MKHPETGKVFALIRPSNKAMFRVKAEMKALTCRKALWMPTEVVRVDVFVTGRKPKDNFFLGTDQVERWEYGLR